MRAALRTCSTWSVLRVSWVDLVDHGLSQRLQHLPLVVVKVSIDLDDGAVLHHPHGALSLCDEPGVVAHDDHSCRGGRNLLVLKERRCFKDLLSILFQSVRIVKLLNNLIEDILSQVNQILPIITSPKSPLVQLCSCWVNVFGLESTFTFGYCWSFILFKQNIALLLHTVKHQLPFELHRNQPVPRMLLCYLA